RFARDFLFVQGRGAFRGLPSVAAARPHAYIWYIPVVEPVMNLTLPPKVTDRAFARLAEIGAAAQGKALRVAVDGGGCSGFQYQITLDDPQGDDLVLESQGEKVVIDTVSLPFLENAVITFSEELI